MSRLRTAFFATTLLVATVALTVDQAAAATLPPGFSDNLVASMTSPTAIAFLPDGTMLVTMQAGQLRVVTTGGSLLPTPALNITTKVCSDSERGLLGVAVDPSWTTNHFVFLYYTFKKSTSCPTSSNLVVNRVSRFTMNAQGTTLDPLSEAVLIDNMKSWAGNHNGGDVQFGKDGNLYASVGDSGCDYANNSGCAGGNDAARDLNVLVGKIMRIDRNGNIPAGNPFMGAGTARCNTGDAAVGIKCQETYSWGLRNPFRIAFDPNAAGTVFHINDVGQNLWEEIDIGQAGADFEWNVCEGKHANGSATLACSPPMNGVHPILEYPHGPCNAITGGAFVPNGLWGSPYDGSYLFSDYVCNKMFRLVNQGGGNYTMVDFASGFGAAGPVHMTFGPFGGTQALYYTTYDAGGQVRRISFTASNTPPIASFTANPMSGGPPLNVSFNGGASSDPDPGDSISFYNWTFGDGATQQTTVPTTTHNYTVACSCQASLIVVDNHGTPSTSFSKTISVGNTPPNPPVIQSPAAGFQFKVGQTLTLTGSATDPEQGALPNTALSWVVLRHHDTHTHPWFSGTGNNLTFPTPAPEDLAATTNSYLEIYLTAIDSGGLTSTTQRNIFPHTVAITFATNPTGKLVKVNGTTFTGPTTITSWEGWGLAVDVPKQSGFKFQSWSDGGAKKHTIVTPATATTYSATLTAGGPR